MTENRTGKKGWPWNEEVDPSVYGDLKWPKISIVTPSYNQGQFIEETIRSVLSQNYPNLEYIIIDGGSNDQSVDIIKSYSDRIQYWVSEKDAGQSDALIKGFNKASGDIFNWINSDDILHPKGLYYIAKAFMDNPELEFVHGRNGIMSVESEPVGFMPHPDDQLEARYLCEMPYGQQACFFRRQAYFESGGINRDIRFSMDFDLYVKMHALGIRSRQIHELIGSYREHQETKTSNLESVMRHENGNIFATLLFSVGDKRKAEFFTKMGFSPYSPYKVRPGIPKSLVRQATLMFLKKNIWYYYEKDLEVAHKMAWGIIKMDWKNIFNTHYLKIITDRHKHFKA